MFYWFRISMASNKINVLFVKVQKHPFRGVLRKRCSDNCAANLKENTHTEV